MEKPLVFVGGRKVNIAPLDSAHGCNQITTKLVDVYRLFRVEKEKPKTYNGKHDTEDVSRGGTHAIHFLDAQRWSPVYTVWSWQGGDTQVQEMEEEQSWVQQMSQAASYGRASKATKCWKSSFSELVLKGLNIHMQAQMDGSRHNLYIVHKDELEMDQNPKGKCMTP